MAGADRSSTRKGDRDGSDVEVKDARRVEVLAVHSWDALVSWGDLTGLAKATKAALLDFLAETQVALGGRSCRAHACETAGLPGG